MRVTLVNTDRKVALRDGVLARIWEGTTETGVRVHCLITTVAVKNGQPPEVYKQFEDELLEITPVTQDALDAFPMRMVQ